jgi:hypothetical protein
MNCVSADVPLPEIARALGVYEPHSAEGYFPKVEKHGGGGQDLPSHGTAAVAIARNTHPSGSPWPL